MPTCSLTLLLCHSTCPRTPVSLMSLTLNPPYCFVKDFWRIKHSQGRFLHSAFLGLRVHSMGPGAPTHPLHQNSAGPCATHVGDSSGAILDLEDGSSGLVPACVCREVHSQRNLVRYGLLRLYCTVTTMSISCNFSVSESRCSSYTLSYKIHTQRYVQLDTGYDNGDLSVRSRISASWNVETCSRLQVFAAKLCVS